MNKSKGMRSEIMVFICLVFMFSCDQDTDTDIPDNVDFRQEMRAFVIGISDYTRSVDPDFIVVSQNGIELVTNNGEEDGPLHSGYLDAIDGHGQEDLFYGYDENNEPTPGDESQYLRTFLDRSQGEGNVILVTDYCSSTSKMNDSYLQNQSHQYVPFAAPERELNIIPDYPDPIFSENNEIIHDLNEVENFLYLINPENFNTKSDFISAIKSTNYDMLIMDIFFDDDVEFSAAEIEMLSTKANGGERLVLAYISIGEAEDYRYYWQSAWKSAPPEWIDYENPYWEGNYKVRYWMQDWQDIIYGNESSYLKKIIDAGFDGVYLDIIDAYEYYE